jgi:hypothetical protein
VIVVWEAQMIADMLIVEDQVDALMLFVRNVMINTRFL